MIYVGVDIGTGSSKAVAVDADGVVLASARRDNRTDSPAPGRFEHDAEQVWLQTPVALIRDVVRQLAERSISPDAVAGLGLSGIGPAVVPTDAEGRALRPAILYGIDTRATEQIRTDTDALGEAEIMQRCGSGLSTQSIGPKLSWIAQHEPEVWARTRMVHCANSFTLHHLTGAYVWDRYTASAADPLYDLPRNIWWADAWRHHNVAGELRQPDVVPCGAVAGHLHADGAAATGLHEGTPVLAGAVDAMAEAYSVGVREPGDTMLMFGSTLFMIQVTRGFAISEPLWAVGGVTQDDHGLAAGMSTGGLVIDWTARQLGLSVPDMMQAAEQSPSGARGLLMLPYLSGERTPFSDPQARGAWLGLSLRHQPADLARSTLESVGYGIRHNLERMAQLGAEPTRLVAVGGGTQSRLWLQCVSDICQLPLDLPPITVGASYGDARMAADALGVDTRQWNSPVETIDPDTGVAELHDEVFSHYVAAYPALRDSMHALARHNN